MKLMIARKRIYRGNGLTVERGKHFWAIESEMNSLIARGKARMSPTQPGKRKPTGKHGK